jgi:hypothetical protein
LAEGIILYVAVPGINPIAASVWAMDVPDPAVAPVTSNSVTVHENVVPPTAPVRAIDGAVPEQIVCDAGVAIATGDGLTVIKTELLVRLPQAGFPVAVATIW